MAHYTIHATCGHEYDIQLVGPTSRREWIIGQRERELCPECARKEALERAADDTTPITATLGVEVAQRVNKQPGECDMIVSLKGGTMRRKDEIKTWGFSWGESGVGLFGMIARQPKCWHKAITIPAAEIKRLYDLASTSPDSAAPQVAAEMLAVVRRMAGLPDDIVFEAGNLNHPDTHLLFRAIAEAVEAAKVAEEAARREAEIVSMFPPEPAWRGIRAILGAPANARWNGKFYGRDNDTVYLDGEKWHVSPSQYREYRDGQAARKAWQDECARIRAVATQC